MPSLSNIPEPTTAYRPEADASPAPTVPLIAGTTDANALSDPTHQGPGNRTLPTDTDQPQHQIDGVSCVLLLLIAGALLRVVLSYFGPMQGISEAGVQALIDSGRSALAGNPADAFPLFDVVCVGVSVVGVPDWFGVAVGSLLTLAAVPAAYFIGHATTRRRAAGVLAAALLAVHPAVLASANALSATALAMSLVTIGLALVCHSAKRGTPAAAGGAVALALAGLAAPLCWVVALCASPLAARLAWKDGPRRSLGLALTVLVLGVGPVLAYRAAFFGPSPEALLAEFASTPLASEPPPAIDRLLITMTDPSLAELGEALNLPLGDAGRLAVFKTAAPVPEERRDVVADVLADAWLLLNAGLAGLATVSMGVMLVRRRVIELLVLATPLGAAAFVTLPPGETIKLPMIALLGVLSVGLISVRPTKEVNEERLAAKAAKKAAKAVAKEEKERAKQERELNKYKGGMYAFDKPSRREKKQRDKQHTQAHEPAEPTAILTERVADDSSAPARPI